MAFRSVLLTVVSVCISFSVNVADSSVSDRGFERRHDISGLVLNVHEGKVRSLLDCGALCRSLSCKVFCYKPTSALCRLSLPTDPIVQTYDGSGSKCYSPIGCPVNAGYAWYGVRCIKQYTVKTNYEQANITCSLDGGHLYHFKTLEWDLPAAVGLREANVSNENRVWVGADDLKVGGQFRWSDSSVLANDSALWAPGEPDKSVQRCVMVHVNPGQLHNYRCSFQLQFVCQIDV